ncbi:hypothetical protein BCR41DRAFT_344259 [Lobosporangium transversale]|uniref:Uncharacterized protein n=1 Tax=Lobosporangium transversale TaxID=64571 RepID=A0A1Y2H4I7_9FUNG|nr:hypothetical protein BCR41DRAFT_344259 [Lobosporangium transversale]ORZ28901.1 hypothetical protein BCR41DRAFT_344259 [Lobosporangium transversale]|eukprot:XP_021886574.1 hypothetical protein BCR41DRAFT_344259 [Lobosporangium transversale]
MPRKTQALRQQTHMRRTKSSRSLQGHETNSFPSEQEDSSGKQQQSLPAQEQMGEKLFDEELFFNAVDAWNHVYLHTIDF